MAFNITDNVNTGYHKSCLLILRILVEDAWIESAADYVIDSRFNYDIYHN